MSPISIPFPSEWIREYTKLSNFGLTKSSCNPCEKMHLQRTTIWCGFGSGGVIGPYFFEDEAEIAVTVNGIRYRSTITKFLWPQLNDMDMDNMWFQQYGATCHTAHETITLDCSNDFQNKLSQEILIPIGHQDHAI